MTGINYRKKPVIIQARRNVGGRGQATEVAAWCGGILDEEEDYQRPSILIRTLEGTMAASYGDWVIKGVAGEFYPCKPDVFEQTYEPAP